MRSDFRLRRCPRFLEPGRKTAEAARGVLRRDDIPQHQMETLDLPSGNLT